MNTLQESVKVDSWQNDQTGELSHHVLVDVSGEEDWIEFTCKSELHARVLEQALRQGCVQIYPA